MTTKFVDLLDRGWRRSGSFLYKPEMDSTCCSSYTIRLRAVDFRPSKEQLRVSRRMQRFLDGKMDIRKSCEPLNELTTNWGSCSSLRNGPESTIESLDCKREVKNKEDKILFYLSEEIDQAKSACSLCGTLPQDIHLPKASVKRVPLIKRKLHVEGCEELVSTSSISFQIAAAIQRARSTGKHVGEEENVVSDEFSPNQIAEKLTSLLIGVLKGTGLSIRACNGHINMYAAKKSINMDGVSLNLLHYEDTCMNGKQKKGSQKVAATELHHRRQLESSHFCSKILRILSCL